MQDLLARAATEVTETAPNERICRGPLLSRAQYLPDVLRNGFSDARIGGESHMTAHDVQTWTDAIEAKDRPQV
jgi:hypothetical protein